METIEIHELTEVMCQQGNSKLIDLLNEVSTSELHHSNIALLEANIIDSQRVSYPKYAFLIHDENELANIHNVYLLNSVPE